MDDRARAEELLAEAWQRQPKHELERVEILLSALVHALLTLTPHPDAQPPENVAAGLLVNVTEVGTESRDAAGGAASGGGDRSTPVPA